MQSALLFVRRYRVLTYLNSSLYGSHELLACVVAKRVRIRAFLYRHYPSFVDFNFQSLEGRIWVLHGRLCWTWNRSSSVHLCPVRNPHSLDIAAPLTLMQRWCDELHVILSLNQNAPGQREYHLPCANVIF